MEKYVLMGKKISFLFLLLAKRALAYPISKLIESFFISHIWNTFFFIQSKQWPWRNIQTPEISYFLPHLLWAKYMLTFVSSHFWGKIGGPKGEEISANLWAIELVPGANFCWAPQEEYGHHELGIISSRAYVMTLEAKGILLPPPPFPHVSVAH
jgi:hypothetical protein